MINQKVERILTMELSKELSLLPSEDLFAAMEFQCGMTNLTMASFLGGYFMQMSGDEEAKESLKTVFEMLSQHGIGHELRNKIMDQFLTGSWQKGMRPLSAKNVAIIAEV